MKNWADRARENGVDSPAVRARRLAGPRLLIGLILVVTGWSLLTGAVSGWARGVVAVLFLLALVGEFLLWREVLLKN